MWSETHSRAAHQDESRLLKRKDWLGLHACICALLATGLVLAQPSAPTFSHDVAPIIYQNCAACHHRGGPGPFPLITYEEVKKHARQIAAVTRTRYMPPWLPSPGYGDFIGERRLTSIQIEILAKWVRAGAPEGNPSEIPVPPQFNSEWQLGPPDLVLKASQPFTLPPDGPNLFWNFVFKPDIQTTKYVRAVEIRPGKSNLIHHANLIVDRIGSSIRQPRAMEGFPGMDVRVDRSVFDPVSHFLFWKPGTVPYSEPDGLSWRLDPGNYLILNTHLQPSGKPEEVQPEIGLYFTDQPPTKFPIVIELEDDDALDIPPGVRDFLARDDFRLPVDADLLAIYPHAHYLGKRLEAYATLPSGKRQWLIRIPNWDLNWQAVYRYRHPVFLPKGSVISMRFHYDNSSANPRNPHHPPKRVQAGNQATDEMAHLWLQILPRGEGDHRRPLQEAQMRHEIEKHPNNFEAHMNLGALLLSRLDAQGAASELELAIRLEPERAEPHDMLGIAFENLGRFGDALEQYRIALQDDPSYLNAHYDLARALARRGDLAEAVRHLKIVAAAYPDNVGLQNQLQALLKAEQVRKPAGKKHE
jgi:tetratricopeptide (TPR) repeat protein